MIIQTTHIPFLHQLNEDFYLGSHDRIWKYSKEFLNEMFEKYDIRNKIRLKDLKLELFSLYANDNFSEYYESIKSDRVLHDILHSSEYTNPYRVAAHISAWDFTGLLINIDDEYTEALRLKEILKYNKVLATIIWNWDDECIEATSIRKIVLCIGMINNHILFI